MRDLVYTGFMSLDCVVDSPGGGPGEEHRNGGWVVNDIEFLPEAFALKGEELAETTALMFGRRSYETMPTNGTPSGTGAVPVLVSGPKCPRTPCPRTPRTPGPSSPPQPTSSPSRAHYCTSTRYRPTPSRTPVS